MFGVVALNVEESALAILPRRIQRLISPLPHHSYGIKRVVLHLADGSAHLAYVAWNKQVMWVPGEDRILFDPLNSSGQSPGFAREIRGV